MSVHSSNAGILTCSSFMVTFDGYVYSGSPLVQTYQVSIVFELLTSKFPSGFQTEFAE